MKRLILAGIVTLGAFTAIGVTAPKANAANCDGVRCMACPDIIRGSAPGPEFRSASVATAE